MASGSKVREVEDEWMGLNPAAMALGISRYKLTRWIVAGDLDAKYEAGRQLVTRASVMALKQRLNRKTA